MTSQQEERIAQFRKMANDDPENELGHFSLGRALMDAGAFGEAAAAFQRTIEINPKFSKAHQLLGSAFAKAGLREKAVAALKQGFEVADERGDNVPRDEMAALLRELGEIPPAPRQPAPAAAGGGFRCQRPGCQAGGFARRLPAPPPLDEDLARLVYDRVCADCWRDWLGMGIKVINEMRLDLSDERCQQVYDNYMREYLGLT